MRGKGGIYHEQNQRRRITPAYAGKSYQNQRGIRADRDHPRLCGEKLLNYVTARSSWGSPPPMRGKDIEWNRGFPNVDHPRLCGEKAAFCVLSTRPVGSPPPMRGKAETSTRPPQNARITPAYAGKS